MDTKTPRSNYSSFLRKYWLPLSLGALGMIFFIYGLISLVGSASKQPDVTFTKANASSKNTNQIAVDVEGAVMSPGVYRLSEGSIIQDAFVASGGLTDDADREFVAKNINLASKLTAGAKIYVPREGEPASEAQSLGTENTTGLININTASSQELDSLPGIGPVTSEKIINNRPYASVNDLLDKKVVTSKVFTEIKDKVSVY